MFEGLPVSIIAAVAHGRVIGSGNHLPWHIPTDLARFKALTLGKPLVMGRATFASIGRVLPGRTTIVLSRSARANVAGGVLYATSLSEALSLAAGAARNAGAGEIMVAGGAEVFRALLPAGDRLYITEVDLQIAGDIYFPAYEGAAWRETARFAPPRAPDDEAAVTFVDMRRVRADTPL